MSSIPESPPDGNSARAILAEAVGYAKRGLRVVPLCWPAPDSTAEKPRCGAHGDKCGTSTGKCPLIAKWQHHASSDPEVIRGWWDSWPDANVGVALGSKSGIVALDIDGEGGEARLPELAGGDLTATWEAKTRNGRRLIYLIPESLDFDPETRIEKSPASGEVRLQSTGGQCVMPPSQHWCGCDGQTGRSVKLDTRLPVPDSVTLLAAQGD